MPGTVRDLGRETNLLIRRLRGWTGSSWDVRIPGGQTRATRVRLLIDEFAELGRLAGSGAPAGAQPPAVAPHALPDQLTVLVEDFIEAVTVDGAVRPQAEDLVARATRAVAEARADLDVGFGFRPA